jgi:hypothetical protein
MLALVALAVAPMVVLRTEGTGNRTGGPPAPAGPTAADRTPAEYTQGYRLADARVAELPRENTFTYTFTPTSYDFELMLWCDSDRGNRLRAFIADREVLTDYCEPDGRRQEVMPLTHSDPLPQKRERWTRFGVVVNEPVTVTVKVHAGMDDLPQVATASGTAKLLLYLPVLFADYPFPPRPARIQRFDPVLPDPARPVINMFDATGAPVNGYAPLTVTKRPGRSIELGVNVHGPGVVRLYANNVLVRTVECWDWVGVDMTMAVDPDVVAPTVAPGAPFTVAIETEHFTAPVLQLIVRDAPPQAAG